MQIPDYTITCFIKKHRTSQKGKAPIYFKIRIGDQKMELSTKKSVDPAHWDNKKQEVILAAKDNTINTLLQKMRADLNKAISQLYISGADVNFENIKKLFSGDSVQKTYKLIHTTEEHNTEFEKQVGVRYAYGSYKNYKTTLVFLKEFIPHEYQTTDIPLKNVNDQFCEKFFIWLTTHKTCKQNGANKHIQRVKKIINYACKMGYISSSSIKSFSLAFRVPTRESLTWEEVQLIHKLDLKNERLEHIRNIILFQIYTGLAYADVKAFCKKHLYKGVDGNLWLKMERTKTHNTFTVPLLQPAVTVLNKYLEQVVDLSTPIFPVLSNQKMNAYLKIIQEIAGISKKLHTHLFRHTFASTITLQSGIPLETVSKMLGHSKITITQIYARVGELKIAADMKGLSAKLSSKLTDE
ncbi:MAG: site-specific integrase [Bacteroidota bacterium]|nr:site-specific integrase [Bacteroidota bacterium]